MHVRFLASLQYQRDLWKIVAFLLGFFTPLFFSFADEFTSASYRVADPVIAPANFSSSNNFQLWSTVSEIGLGTSTSSSFQSSSGFLQYPSASSPALSATPGDGQVALSWTPSQGFLGWTPSGYNVGQSTSVNGPYSFVSLGNVTSFTQTGLTNGVLYYFVVTVKDIFGNVIASSSPLSATPLAPVVNPPPSPQGGGGGGAGGGSGFAPTVPTVPAIQTSVEFSGRAYPLSKVNILKDGQVALTTVAGPDSNFFASLHDLSAGNYTFSVYGEDKNGLRSSLFTFPVFITSGVTTKIGGIFIAPTIAVDKSEVRRGDTITIFGQSVPNANITINVNSESNIFVQKQSDKNGVYLLSFDSSVLLLGDHSAKSKAAFDGEVSQFGDPVSFKVSSKNREAKVAHCPQKGDLNGDCRVNLVDFSIAAYWYKRPLSPAFKKIEETELDGDDKIDLTDFSIMAYYWTG